jgi:hypothetical protein
MAKNVAARCELASNPNTSHKMLDILACDENAGVRYRIARNPNTPGVILTKLAGDESWGIRYFVEKHPNTPELVKLYLNNPDFAGLTLAEFLAAAGGTAIADNR